MTIKYDNRPLDRIEKRLDGTVYIGVAGPEEQIGRASRSIANMHRRQGDSDIVYREATQGQEARQYHVEQFLASKHDFILFLDSDMLLEPDALERLRSHGLPCVTGLAFRRTWEPTLIPAWTEDGGIELDAWPPMPFRETPEPGRLYRLGSTGFFCWLIHRSVFEAVEPVLKGEPFVWYDDMDVWPYDLKEVLAGREQLRPLLGARNMVGADYRLSFFIRAAGFTIWGDPAVHCGHYVHYPLGIKDWEGHSREFREKFAQVTEENLQAVRAELRDQRAQAIGEERAA